jgi:hypothetical protein
LLDTLGDVMGNKTLFENMLSHFEAGSNGGGTQGGSSSADGAGTPRVKRTVAQAFGRSMQTNLLRLGLRTLRSKFLDGYSSQQE